MSEASQEYSSNERTASPRRDDFSRDLLMPALRSEDDSFPVLKAFQDYLEEERERARKRLLTVSILAITSLVLVVASFLVVGALVVGNLSRRNDQLQDLVLRTALRDISNAAQAPRVSEPDPELRRVQDMLQRLQADNAAMQTQVAVLSELPASIASSVNLSLSNLAERVETAKPPRTPVAVAMPPASPAPFAPAAKMAEPLTVEKKETGPQPAVVEKPSATSSSPSVVESVKSVGEVVSGSDPGSAADSGEKTRIARKADPNARVTLNVPEISHGPPRIEGFRPEQTVLTTDRNIHIPWRIVLPDPE